MNNNTVKFGDTGMLVMYSEYNNITNNLCENNDQGVTLYSGNNTIANNTLFNNTYNGIVVYA